jgi:hypothetical protein
VDDSTVQGALVAGAIGGLIVGGVLGYLARAVQYEMRRAHRIWRRNGRGLVMLGRVAVVLVIVAAVAGLAIFQTVSS